MKTGLLLILFLSQLGLLHAQKAPITPLTLPEGILMVRKTPEYSQWKINLKPSSGLTGSMSDSSKPTAGLDQTRTFTKTGKIMRVQTFSSGKLLEDRWIVGDFQIIHAPGMKFPFVSNPGPDAPDIRYDTTDFPELSWISKSNFLEVKNDLLLSKKVLVFGDKLVRKFDYEGQEVNETSSVEAFLDFESRLPLAVRDGANYLTYEYLPAPKAMQVLPEDIQMVLKENAFNNAIANRKVGKP